MTIKNSPITLEAVQSALRKYKSLILSSRLAIDDQSSVLEKQMQRKKSLKEKAISIWRRWTGGDGDCDGWEANWRCQIGNMLELWSSYSAGIAGLESQVKGLETYRLMVPYSVKSRKTATD